MATLNTIFNSFSSAARSGSTTGWGSPGNAQSADGSFSTGDYPGPNTLGSTYTTTYLKCTGLSTGVPTGSTINGITISVKRKSSSLSPSVVDLEMSLVKAGNVTGDNKASGSAWPTSNTTTTYGGTSDLWGLSLSYTDVNDPSFGAALAVTENGSAAPATALAQVDQIAISIDYSLGSITGTSATTMDDFTSVGTARAKVSGTSATTLDDFSSYGQGTVGDGTSTTLEDLSPFCLGRFHGFGFQSDEDSGTAPPAETFYILLQDGGELLLQTGDIILTQAAP